MAARSTTPTTSPITVRNTEEQTWASHLAQEHKEYLADKRWRRELDKIQRDTTPEIEAKVVANFDLALSPGTLAYERARDEAQLEDHLRDEARLVGHESRASIRGTGQGGSTSK